MRTLRLLASCVVALVLAACSSEALVAPDALRIPVYEQPRKDGDPQTYRRESLLVSGFTRDQLRDIGRAARHATQLWGVEIDVVENGSARFTMAAAPGRHPNDMGILAETTDRNVIVYFGDTIVRRHLCGIVLHEIGHLLGNGHTTEGIMAPKFESTTHRCPSDPHT